jgi:hypothetical protein
MPVRSRISGHADLDPDIIRIGRDIIEILTSGMYISPATIYREYVQNSADAIDLARRQGTLQPHQTGRVSISFDHAIRSVSIRDNGAGIPGGEVIPTLLAMGSSSKRGTGARGFRGVGRLSGLAYCRTLEFRTKAVKDNVVSVMTWDCRSMRSRLSDAAYNGDLRRIILESVSTSLDEADDADEHFFEVRMADVPRLRNDLLLNERLIGDYLAQIAPVPFAPDFAAGRSIEEYLSRFVPQGPIELTVSGAILYRPHRDELVVPGAGHKIRLRELELVEFANVDGEIGSVGWIGHHDYTRSISVGLGVRGLRARLAELQVGEANLFDECFKEPRFNGWTIGEVHVLDRRIIPNARRDNFEVNHHYYNLLAQLGPVAEKITQRCRSASISRNAVQMVLSVIREVDGRIKQRRPFDRAELSRLKSLVMRAQTKLKRVDDSKLRKRLGSKVDRLQATLAKSQSKRGASVVALDEAATLISRFISNREQARRLVEELRRLCG